MAGSIPPARVSRFIDPVPPTVGIEEEFFVVNPHTRRVSPDAAVVVRRAGTWSGGSISTEFTKYQVETRTEPCVRLDELSEQVGRMRDIAAGAAASQRLRITATGTPVQGDIVPPPIADIPRYRETTAMFRTLQDGQSI
ncbi:MAG: glutamate-cysteine ligase family protein, partial [Stackebrandtia sp.]